MEEGMPWLNKEFLEAVLKDNLEKSSELKVEDFTEEDAVEKGNNFVCDIRRVAVRYRPTEKEGIKTFQMILKDPRHGGLHDMILHLGVVEKELKIYNELIPKINAVTGVEYLTPRHLKTDKEGVLIMEDLKYQGFKMVDRAKQLDFDHSVVALKALAKFHAASVKVYEDDPEIVENAGKEVIYNDEVRDVSEILFCRVFAMAGLVIDGWPESKKYAKCLSGYEEKAWNILEGLMRPRPEEFKVLNHGDFWITNMLFKYSDGIPVQVKLLDLQVSRYTSPAADLTYFLSSSVQEEVRISRYNDLIQSYTETLNSEMKRHGIKRTLNIQELAKSMKVREFIFLHTTFTVLPLIVSENIEIVEMKTLERDHYAELENNPFRCYLEADKFRKICSGRLRELEHNDFFKGL